MCKDKCKDGWFDKTVAGNVIHLLNVPPRIMRQPRTACRNAQLSMEEWY